MRSRIGFVCMVAGAGLLLSAAVLLFYNVWDDWRAGQAAVSVWESLEEAEESGEMVFLVDDDPQEGEEPVLEVGGIPYIGVLSVSDYDLELPVMETWSYAGLKIAPGRYSGSAGTDDLVICGHNYRRHFGNLRYLEAGDRVVFTDVYGSVFDYEVVEVETLDAAAVGELLDRESEDWDLTLFTCTPGGQARVTVRCRRVKEGRT